MNILDKGCCGWSCSAGGKDGNHRGSSWMQSRVIWADDPLCAPLQGAAGKTRQAGVQEVAK